MSAGPTDPVEAAPPLDVPPEMGLDTAADARRFLIKGDHANLWFEGQGDALVVSFDNLATIDEGWPRGPWAWRRSSMRGRSAIRKPRFRGVSTSPSCWSIWPRCS